MSVGVRCTDVGHLQADEYFLVPGAASAFLCGHDKRITRLHDGVFIGSLFGPKHPVIVVSREAAIGQANAYNQVIGVF